MNKSLYASAAVLALVLASPVLAQPNDKNDENRLSAGHVTRDNEPRGDKPERPAPGSSPSGTVGAERTTRAPSDTAGTMGETGAKGHRERGSSTMAPANTMMAPSGRKSRARAGTGTNVTAPTGGASVQRGAHVHNPKFDSMRRVTTAARRFHVAAYVRPSGWYYHRWTFGEFLPAFFFVRTYWILDWSDFGLILPPPGTVWVRVGDDAILIDQFTGEIIIVEYGVFY